MKYHLFTLLTLTVGGSLMGGLLLLLRGRPSKLPRSFFYYAWLLVLLRLALPVPGLMALALPRLSAPPAQVEETVSHQTPEAAPVLPAADTALPTQPIQPERVPSPVPAAPQSAREAPEAPLPGKDPFPLYDGLALVWALGFVLVLGRDLVGYWRFRAVLRKTLKPAKASDLAVYNALTGTRRPRLRRSAAVDTPMLMGVFRPLLLLPDRDYNEETLTCIFKHELTHFRRGDILVKWLAMPVLAVHWFNPLTFFMGREIDRFCELSCDERILKNMDKDQRRQYGQTLLVLAARTTTARNTLATTFSTEKKNLKERLVQIMNFSPKSKKAILAAALLLVMVAGCLLAFGPGSQPSRDGVVRNVDELLEAIDSNAAIILEPGTYDLTTAKTYGMANVSDRYHWEDRIDGYQLVIDKVENLTITGRDMERCQIVTAPRYAAVLSFDGAANVTLSSFTAGHSEGPGNCVGPVVQVNNCQAMTVRDCVLYGCGTRGLDGYDSANVEVLNCDIKECSLGGVYFMSCDNIQVRECRIYDCGHSEDFQAYDLFSFLQCRNALVQNCQVRSNRADRLMLTLTSQNVWFLGNRVEQNQLDCLFRVDGTAPMVADCAFDALTDEPVKGSFELLDSVSSPDGAQAQRRGPGNHGLRQVRLCDATV